MSWKSECVLWEVNEERTDQDAKWGQQDHADGTGGETTVFGESFRDFTNVFRSWNDQEFDFDRDTGKWVPHVTTWAPVLLEEVFEACEETDPQKLRAELIQVAAVAVAWVESIDRRSK